MPLTVKKKPSLKPERAQVQGGFHLRDNTLKEVLVLGRKVAADFSKSATESLCPQTTAFTDAVLNIVRVYAARGKAV